jgi:transposase-like protein
MSGSHDVEFPPKGLSGHNSKNNQALRRLLEGGPGQLFPNDEALQPAERFQTQRRLTDEEKEAIVNRYQNGTPMAMLAQEFGVHRRTVRELLDRRGIERRLRVMTPAQIDEAIRLYQQGLSLAAVGRRFGVEHSTIRKHLVALGIPRRDTHGHER